MSAAFHVSLSAGALWSAVGGAVLPFWPVVVHAAQSVFKPHDPGGVPKDLGGAILGIVQVSLLLVGVLALGFIVYGGFLYITSQGDEKQLETAKSTVTYAVIGIAVIGIAYAIVEFVFRAF